MGLDKFAGRNHDEPMTERRWAGLLRAVNVGGRKMPMAELRQLAEEAGFTEVSTLLASGNLLFTGAGSEGDIRGRLERSIADHTGFTVEVLLRSKEQLRGLLANNPFPDGRPAQVLVCFLDAVAPAALADKLAGVAVNERIAGLGGICVPAHPFREIGLASLMERILDVQGFAAVETHNGGNSDDDNSLALHAAGTLGLPTLGGSDCHKVAAVGRCATEFTQPVSDMAGFIAAVRAGACRGDYYPPYHAAAAA